MRTYRIGYGAVIATLLVIIWSISDALARSTGLWVPVPKDYLLVFVSAWAGSMMTSTSNPRR